MQIAKCRGILNVCLRRSPRCSAPAAHPRTRRMMSSATEGLPPVDRGAVGRLSVQQLQQLISSKAIDRVQIIDVREPGEVEVASLSKLIPHVKYFPLSKSHAWANELVAIGESWDEAATESDSELDKHPSAADSTAELCPSRPTLCLCHHGVRSHQMAAFLTGQAQFHRVYNIEGGIDAFSRSVDPSVPTY